MLQFDLWKVRGVNELVEITTFPTEACYHFELCFVLATWVAAHNAVIHFLSAHDTTEVVSQINNQDYGKWCGLNENLFQPWSHHVDKTLRAAFMISERGAKQNLFCNHDWVGFGLFYWKSRHTNESLLLSWWHIAYWELNAAGTQFGGKLITFSHCKFFKFQITPKSVFGLCTIALPCLFYMIWGWGSPWYKCTYFERA